MWPDPQKLIQIICESKASRRGRRTRYGHRRITEELRSAGWIVNGKFVRRICAEEGLKIVPKAHKRRRMGGSGTSRMVAGRKNHVWSYDFVFDQLESGRQLKILPVVDNYTRECLAILVAHNITARDVIELLERLISEYGPPEFLRSDNGPEFIARQLRQWLASRKIATDFIEPGSPWQNAFSESFNSRFLDELLNAEVFTSLLEARLLIEEHRLYYNTMRRHCSLGYLTPREFALLPERRKTKASGKEKTKTADANRAA
ncbi:MAG: IS3 family transposase [Acidobacteriota bacterium]